MNAFFELLLASLMIVVQQGSKNALWLYYIYKADTYLKITAVYRKSSN